MEVKCPISCNSKPIVSEDGIVNVPYLQHINGNLKLCTGHSYYTQCQISLYVCGMYECDLFIWSPAGSCCVTVYRDEEFLQNLVPKLELFYFEQYLPILVERASSTD
ncbi:uncharacterized protein LOC113378640 [Ctenocephalides felis]|uniref:uncharacterized protein LOC113365448 n=1 Tax=Ctenocephalides felis TaxID=7515 RepID=UPI000E6E1C46|nr:uncharacterized protein LOC113365448 [Ctenocephalides felis]XP_026474982.1 uncharacterized protein LOC113378640 [Ctenocephalides felis]